MYSGPTPKQKQVLDFIGSFFQKEGYSPSLTEIARHFKKSAPTIHRLVETLRNKGFLGKKEKIWRGIIPNDAIREVFLLGYIAAGKPIEPIENPELIQIPISMIPQTGSFYALKVQGDSMVDDGILDGDTIIIKHQNTAVNGDRVVAVTEDGATLKVYRENNGKIYLEPKNIKYKTIYPNRLEIRGKFAGLIRN